MRLALTKWNNDFLPVHDLFGFGRDVERVFDGVRVAERHFVPAADFEETKDHYFLTLDLPGMAKEDVKIEVDRGQLIISGERKQEKPAGSHFHSERSFGKFIRSLELPGEINAEKIAATFKDGVLKVEVPKAESQKPRLVQIQ